MMLNASLRRRGEARERASAEEYINRVMDDSSVRGKWQLLLSREACVFLKLVT